MAQYLILLLAATLVVIGLLLLAFGWVRRKMFGVFGRVRYQDLDTESRVFYSKKYQLYGKPDLLLEKDGELIPVELKMGATPSTPHANHVMQVLAYCLLVEDIYGVTPPYGLIRYRAQEFEVKYTPKAKATVVAALAQMREHLQENRVAHRQHSSVGRCRACQFRDRCAESLA